MPYANINGIKTYYDDHGKGDTILLLHNGFSCSKMWEDIYPSLVETGYRVIMYDRRGYGQSERGLEFENFYVSDRFRLEGVKELATLREMLNFDSFHIIGQCEGGVIGVDYAVKYHHQIKTLIVSSTQCYCKLHAREFYKLKFPRKPFRDIEPELREKLIYWHGKDHAELFYNLINSEPGGAYGTEFFDLRDLLPSVTCPTLVLYPDRSYYFDVEQGVAFYRHLPKGELAVLPSCGHNTYENQPKEYIRFVLSFLKRHNF